MMKSLLAFSSLAALAAPTLAQVAVYGQCGGSGYTGSTTCASGSVCVSWNSYYSQCVPGAVTTSAASTTSSASNKMVTSTIKATTTSAAAVVAPSSPSDVPIYGQCGGIGYTGSTICATGTACVYSGPYYSQCLPGAVSSSSSIRTSASTTSKSSTSTTSTSTKVSTTSSTIKTTASSTSISTSSVPPKSTTASSTVKTTSTISTTTSTAPSNSVCPSARTKFKYFGVNEAGAEFGYAVPGVLGTDYIWPSPSSIDFFVDKGMNTFRVPFMIERLAPPASGITGSFNAAYLSGLQTIVNYITSKGSYAVLDPHNYMRYNNNFISASDFQAFWKNLATVFKNNDKVIFDLMNEPNGIEASTVANLMQAGINGVRASGATQLVLVEGTAWTGAHSWESSGNAAAFRSLTDPSNNFAITMHQYLDSDSSGTSENCVSPTIGAERLAVATKWLKDNNLKGFLGEIGGGANSVCIAAVQSALCAMQGAGGVWIGATWWAAGPWWGSYFQSIEPGSGPAVAQVLPQALLPFL